MNFNVARDAAKLKGDCKTPQGNLEADLQNLRNYVDVTSAGIKGIAPDFEAHLKPMISAATTEAIETRIGLITRDLGEVMKVVHIHEQREVEMANCLESVVAPAVGERPAEGRYVVHALEYFESQLEALRGSVGSMMLNQNGTAAATFGSSTTSAMTPIEKAALDR